ncbi:hypothetical protein FOZ61_007109, partial [Perkinsus olseni]
MSFYSIVVTSIAALTSGGSPLQPGKYCSEYLHGKGDNLLYESCLYFELGPSTAKIDYLNYLNLHYFTFRYDNVTFEDDTFILKRHGHTEGQELYPYFDVGFDVKVSTETPAVVKMVTKDEKHVYELTTKSCPDDNFADVFDASTGNSVWYSSGVSRKAGTGEVFAFDPPYTSMLYKVSAEFVFDPVRH